jgi:hypothetical protein
MKMVSRERGWRFSSDVRLPIPTAPGSAAVILIAALVNHQFTHSVGLNPGSFFAGRVGS